MADRVGAGEDDIEIVHRLEELTLRDVRGEFLSASTRCSCGISSIFRIARHALIDFDRVETNAAGHDAILAMDLSDDDPSDEELEALWETGRRVDLRWRELTDGGSGGPYFWTPSGLDDSEGE